MASQATIQILTSGLGPALGAGLAIGISAIATAYAQAKIGAAGMGALAEDDSLFGQALILTVIPETAVIFGLVVALIVTGFI
ncbi:MAG: V-type ATP synthase subunit K [Candidatus Nanohaloarchaea archaeon]